MTSTLGKKSQEKLAGVHPALVKVVEKASTISSVEFIVLEGRRSSTRQAQLVKAGASKTMNSRHLSGHAVDLGAMLNGQIRWDWPLYHQIAKAMKEAAVQLEIPITWGGDWKKFPDGPHFELDRRTYKA